MLHNDDHVSVLRDSYTNTEADFALRGRFRQVVLRLRAGKSFRQTKGGWQRQIMSEKAIYLKFLLGLFKNFNQV